MMATPAQSRNRLAKKIHRSNCQAHAVKRARERVEGASVNHAVRRKLLAEIRSGQAVSMGRIPPDKGRWRKHRSTYYSVVDGVELVFVYDSRLAVIVTFLQPTLDTPEGFPEAVDKARKTFAKKEPRRCASS